MNLFLLPEHCVRDDVYKNWKRVLHSVVVGHCEIEISGIVIVGIESSHARIDVKKIDETLVQRKYIFLGVVGVNVPCFIAVRICGQYTSELLSRRFTMIE